MALTNKLTAIANAIREKTGGTATMTLDEMVTEIGSIEGGGGGGGDPLYINIEEMLQTGDIPDELTYDQVYSVYNVTEFCVRWEDADYCIEEGLVLLTVGDWGAHIVTNDGCYVNTYLPSAYEEDGTSIFLDVSYSNFGYDANTQDASATESDILLGETAYANGEKLEGTYVPNTPCPWGGLNATKVAEYDEQFTLADTSFVIGSSSSTSASTIKASVSNRFTSPTIAIGDKDVVVVQSCKVVPTHNASATGKIQTIAFGAVHVTYISKRKTTDASGKTTRHPAPYNSSIIKYYTSTGAITRAGANYGFYATMQQASTASTTAASTTVRAGSPALAYRCNSSNYETPANCKCVTDCTWDWHVEVYTVDPFSTVGDAANDVIDELISD